MNAGNEQKLTEIFRIIFANDDIVLKDELSAKDFNGWDSLNHIKLMLQIETEFGIKFSGRDTVRLQNIKELKALIDEKTAPV
ncbi:MAG: acyl carrier protein [Fibrobacterales bacterium]